MLEHEVLLWIGFTIFIVLMLLLDLVVINRRAHVISLREALLQSAFWIALALVFNLGIYLLVDDHTVALNFLAGYLVEKSLSVDNLFVILMILSAFSVPPQYQHKVLFWGILGALVMRTVFILAGVALVTKFWWTIFVFGAFLVFTGIKLITGSEEKADPRSSRLIRWLRRIMPVTRRHHNGHFLIHRRGTYYATPLLLALVMVEFSDVLFAVDSIPAILGITTDPFIVYSSNVFAILGLRSLYFALAGLVRIFHYLNYGVALILVFVGAKMLVSHWYHVPVVVALGVIVGVLAAAVVASVLFPPKKAVMVETTALQPCDHESQ